MVHLLVRILGNIVALYAAYWLVPGFVVHGSWKEYLLAGVALGLLNLIVKPIVKLVTFPIVIITMGLFSFIINAAMLWLVDWKFDFIEIHGLLALALATIVISFVNVLFSHKYHKED